jgi:hypothetical protein
MNMSGTPCAIKSWTWVGVMLLLNQASTSKRYSHGRHVSRTSCVIIPVAHDLCLFFC